MTGFVIALLISFFLFLVVSWMINIKAAGTSGHSVRKKLSLAFLGWLSMLVAIVFAFTAGVISGMLVWQPLIYLSFSVLAATFTTYVIVSNPQLID